MRIGPRREHAIRWRGADVGPGAGASSDVALVNELLVRREHREPGNLELFRERARGRDALTGAEHAVENCFAQRVVNLPVQGCLRIPIDRQVSEDVRAGGSFQSPKVDMVNEPIVQLATGPLSAESEMGAQLRQARARSYERRPVTVARAATSIL